MAKKGEEFEERQGALAREFAEFDRVRSDPERRKAIHEKWADSMEAKGIPVLSRDDIQCCSEIRVLRSEIS